MTNTEWFLLFCIGFCLWFGIWRLYVPLQREVAALAVRIDRDRRLDSDRAAERLKSLEDRLDSSREVNETLQNEITALRSGLPGSVRQFAPMPLQRVRHLSVDLTKDGLAGVGLMNSEEIGAFGAALGDTTGPWRLSVEMREWLTHAESVASVRSHKPSALPHSRSKFWLQQDVEDGPTRTLWMQTLEEEGSYINMREDYHVGAALELVIDVWGGNYKLWLAGGRFGYSAHPEFALANDECVLLEIPRNPEARLRVADDDYYEFTTTDQRFASPPGVGLRWHMSIVDLQASWDQDNGAEVRAGRWRGLLG